MIARLFRSGRHERVLRLLDEERGIILNGPLSALKAVVDRREAAIAELTAEGAKTPEPFLQALKAKAERNARLIEASLAGVRAGAAEIDRIEAASGELRTYTAKGASVDVRQQATTRDRRT